MMMTIECLFFSPQGQLQKRASHAKKTHFTTQDAEDCAAPGGTRSEDALQVVVGGPLAGR